MCGITGYFNGNDFFSKEDLEKMTQRIAHRGPDASGFYFHGEMGFGHRRLSVIDLSTAGNQPMFSADKRYVIVYNGEVYNFKEIANELNSESGYAHIDFVSVSDTEVMVEAFARWGPKCVDKFNGMFALAIYDTLNNEIHLFRDRLGIKPLFYYWDGKNFAFASELKALLCAKNIPGTLNRKAIPYFLNMGFIPAPMSIYDSIYKMQAGTYIKLSKQGLSESAYWTPVSMIKTDVIKSEKKALIKLSELLKSSVQYQLKSDVPFGIFLSGGIDSSLITAQAVNLSTVKVNTFSIGFEENKFNESDHARAVAKHLNTNHHEFIVSYKDAIELIDTIFEAYDEPFADSSAIPTMLVSKLAKQHVTVTLSGEGGDELFLGYGAYDWARRMNNPLVSSFRNSIAKLLTATGKNRLQRAAKVLEIKDLRYLSAHILSQEQYLFSKAEVDQLLINKTDHFTPLQLDLTTLCKDRNLTAMEKQSLFDIAYYLPYDLLTKVDRASMFHSLETRVPYLDHRIVEFALNLSPSLKYRGGVHKYIIKEILYQYVPKELLQRPKQGFAIPLENWLHKELKYLIDEYLDEKVITRFGLVDAAEVKKLITDFNNGRSYLYNRLWLLIVLHKWLIKNFKNGI